RQRRGAIERLAGGRSVSVLAGRARERKVRNRGVWRAGHSLAAQAKSLRDLAHCECASEDRRDSEGAGGLGLGAGRYRSGIVVVTTSPHPPVPSPFDDLKGTPRSPRLERLRRAPLERLQISAGDNDVFRV